MTNPYIQISPSSNFYELAIFSAALHLTNIIKEGNSPYDTANGRFSSSPLHELTAACKMHAHHPPEHVGYNQVMLSEYLRLFP